MPPTDDLCGADKPERIPRVRKGKRPFAPSPTGKEKASSASDDGGDTSVAEQVSAQPLTAATFGADNGERKQNLPTSEKGAKRLRKVLAQPVAATNGADNKRKSEIPLPGQMSKKQVLPKPIAATAGADDNGHKDVPVSSDRNRTPFDYNTRKLQLLTLPGLLVNKEFATCEPLSRH